MYVCKEDVYFYYYRLLLLYNGYVICSWSLTQDPNTVAQTTCTTGSAGK